MRPNLILANVALELRSLSDKIKDAETAVGVLTTTLIDMPKTSALQALQNLDVVDQTVLALANYLTDVSRMIHEFPAVDVGQPISKVPLEALEARLRGATLAALEPTSNPPYGQPEIF